MDETMKLELEREEKQRRNRLKELEEMVQKLQSENKKLLSQVGRTSKPATTKIEITPSEPVADKPMRLDEVQDIINLNDVEEDRNEDEWLYVSPVRPPTPQDKSITPDEWLRSGEDENKKRSSIPSLDEVKKQLLCYAMDLELNTSSSKQQGLLSPDTSPKVNLRRVQSLSNKTAQKYLDQVRTKRRSLDRAELSSPTREVGEESQEDKTQHNQQPIESLMKTYALNTSDIHASPNNAVNSSPSLKPRNMPIRAIIPPGKGTIVNSSDHEKETTPPDDDDDLQKRATPPLEYAQKGPSQSPSPDYYEQQEQYNRTGAIQVTNLRKSPVFPRRVIQPAQAIPSPQQQQHRQQLPQPSKSLSPKTSPIMSRRAMPEPSGSIRPPQGGASMMSRLSPGRNMGGGIKAPATTTNKISHTPQAPATTINKSSHTPPGSLQHQQPIQHMQGNIARPMGKPLTKQPSPLQQRKQLMGPGQLSKGAVNHHQQRAPTHRTAVPQRETAPHHQQKNAMEDDSSWMEGCF